MSDDLPALFHSIERRLDALAARTSTVVTTRSRPRSRASRTTCTRLELA